MLLGNENKNEHEGWRRGYFVDQPQYKHWTAEMKDEADRKEKFLVRPYPTGNAICRCASPEDAKWVSERLNLAAKLEKKQPPRYDSALHELCCALGWQGGAIHQVIAEVKRLKAEEAKK